MINEWKKKKKKKKEDRGRLNLPTQDFPPKLSVSIGQPVGGTDITHQEGYMSYKIKGLMKEINEINKELISGEVMDQIDNLIDEYGLPALLEAIVHLSEDAAREDPKGRGKFWLNAARLIRGIISQLK